MEADQKLKFFPAVALGSIFVCLAIAASVSVIFISVLALDNEFKNSGIIESVATIIGVFISSGFLIAISGFIPAFISLTAFHGILEFLRLRRCRHYIIGGIIVGLIYCLGSGCIYNDNASSFIDMFVTNNRFILRVTDYLTMQLSEVFDFSNYIRNSISLIFTAFTVCFITSLSSFIFWKFLAAKRFAKTTNA